MTQDWTTLTLIRWTADFFEKKGIPNPRLDAELLLAHLLQCSRIDLYTDHESKISPKDLARFKELIQRRADREPLQYIVGATEFWGLKVRVTPDVLIPRPETELLVEEALKILNPPNPPLKKGGEGGFSVLDIGTGSGCIAIALAKALPNAKIFGTDISKQALDLARDNAARNDVADRVEFCLADIAPWKTFQAQGRTFDLIVSNAPYIPTADFPNLQPEVRDFEPRKALDGGVDGLEIIRRVLEESKDFLRPEGALLLEVGEGQSDTLGNEISSRKVFAMGKMIKDYSGVDRILLLRRLAFHPPIL